MSDLFDLHKKYVSLKVDERYKYAWPYTETIYPSYFDKVRATADKILEIGVYMGGSVRAVRDYFPNATVIGADLDPQIKDEERLKIVKCDQRSTVELEALGEAYGPFDFIIEDGCHKMSGQVPSLNVMVRYLKPGGVYFIEDVIPKFEDYKIIEYVTRKYVNRNPEYRVEFHPALIAVVRV